MSICLGLDCIPPRLPLRILPLGGIASRERVVPRLGCEEDDMCVFTCGESSCVVLILLMLEVVLRVSDRDGSGSSPPRMTGFRWSFRDVRLTPSLTVFRGPYRSVSESVGSYSSATTLMLDPRVRPVGARCSRSGFRPVEKMRLFGGCMADSVWTLFGRVVVDEDEASRP